LEIDESVAVLIVILLGQLVSQPPSSLHRPWRASRRLGDRRTCRGVGPDIRGGRTHERHPSRPPHRIHHQIPGWNRPGRPGQGRVAQRGSPSAIVFCVPLGVNLRTRKTGPPRSRRCVCSTRFSNAGRQAQLWSQDAFRLSAESPEGDG
jgi:hypothetical protein